ncbi:hypothetical protein G3N57_15210 [Paraburkholderia sp. Se-20369]|nr:hypothetical protein [Paraburkholderia sp. Se-20369]TCW84019.1 hypothetical protein C5O80_13110 [Burkholderia sp. SRS-46]
MQDTYSAHVMRFGAAPRGERLTLAAAIHALEADDADAIVMDIVPEGEREAWWDDAGFSSSPFTKNAHHAGIVATSVTLGQLQREQGEKLVSKAAEYFGVACRVNEGLRQTRFVRLFADALDARPLTIGHDYEVEFLLATRRVYEPFEAPFNFAPHCDDVSYGRDTVNWPLKRSYPRQLGGFLTIQGAANDAGMVMWDNRPESRAVLDRMNGEYRETGAIAELEQARKILLKPQPGQLTLFQSKYLHAIERCTSTRRTMGLFLIHQEDGWRLFD